MLSPRQGKEGIAEFIEKSRANEQDTLRPNINQKRGGQSRRVSLCGNSTLAAHRRLLEVGEPSAREFVECFERRRR